MAPSTLSGRADEDGNAGFLDLLDVLPAVLLLYSDDEVGVKLQEAGHVDLFGSSYDRHLPNRAGRPQAVAGAADDPLPRPEGEEGLGKARNQADDALRGHGIEGLQVMSWLIDAR